MNWSVRPDKKFRLAVGSFLEEYSKKMQVIQLDEDAGEFNRLCEIGHPYPSRKYVDSRQCKCRESEQSQQ